MPPETDIWPDRDMNFTPGGSEEYEQAAWDTRQFRIAHGWAEQDADKAYYAEMSGEGYGPEMEME